MTSFSANVAELAQVPTNGDLYGANFLAEIEVHGKSTAGGRAIVRIRINEIRGRHIAKYLGNGNYGPVVKLPDVKGPIERYFYAR